MPYVHCLCGKPVEPAGEEAFKTAAAKAMTEVAGKPESYLFVGIQGGQTLFVRGARGEGAAINVSLVGTLTRAQKKELATRFCQICQDTLNVPRDAVYVVFAEVPGENWGWSGGTFG
jgi:phenylpyruvate tautomerase